jgi:tRNA-binding EMAP/Myf-like protein
MTSALSSVTTQAKANVTPTGVESTVSTGFILVYGEIDTSQTPSYSEVATTQSPNYTTINAGRDAA